MLAAHRHEIIGTADHQPRQRTLSEPYWRGYCQAHHTDSWCDGNDDADAGPQAASILIAWLRAALTFLMNAHHISSKSYQRICK